MQPVLTTADRIVSTEFGNGEVCITAYIFNRTIEEDNCDDICKDHDHYGGIGQPFARCSYRRTKRRTVFFIRSGWDV